MKLKDVGDVEMETVGQFLANALTGAEAPKRLKVHGLLVHGDRPRLTKGYRNRIRAFNHMLKAGKVLDKDVNRLSGHIKYSKSVDDY